MNLNFGRTNSCASFCGLPHYLCSSFIFVLPLRSTLMYCFNGCRSTLMCCFCGCRDLKYTWYHLQEHYSKLYLCYNSRRRNNSNLDRFYTRPIWLVTPTSLIGCLLCTTFLVLDQSDQSSWPVSVLTSGFKCYNLQNLLNRLFTPSLGDIRGPFRHTIPWAISLGYLIGNISGEN